MGTDTEISWSSDFQTTAAQGGTHYSTSVDEKQITVMNLNAQDMMCSADLYQTHHSMSDAFSFSVCSVLEKANTVSNHLLSLMTHDTIFQTGGSHPQNLVTPIISTVCMKI